MMRVFTPDPHEIADADFTAQMARQTGCEPFAQSSMALLADLSRRLLALPRQDDAPQLTALGFWLRPAALEQLRQRFLATALPDGLAAPRGLALHLPPANVDTLFAYSWALSVLAGNANVVRLPARLNPVAAQLLNCVSQSLDSCGEAGRHQFCWYPADGPGNAALSALADVRLVWGGDAKTQALGRIPVRPGGVSLGFPDRFSYATVNASAYGALEDRDALAERFFNDVFWFGQMGCASPHVLYWVGDGEGPQDFLDRLNAIAQHRVRTETGQALAKMVLINELAAEGGIHAVTWHSNALVSMAGTDGLNLRGRVVGGGMLAVVQVPALDAIATQVERRDQTLTHFGFTPNDLMGFARKAAPFGLCRLVPMGQALDFDAVWDGFDLLRSLTRHVIVRG